MTTTERLDAVLDSAELTEMLATCSVKGCDDAPHRKSRHGECLAHKRARRQAMVAGWANDKVERDARYATFAQIYAAAHVAGEAAAKAHRKAGSEGFATIICPNAGTSWGQWLQRTHGWGSSPIRSGAALVVPVTGQNVGKHMAYGKAFVAVLRSHDITAFAVPRLADDELLAG